MFDAQVLAAVIPRIAGTTGDEQAEAVAVTTMLMEVVTVLHTPEVALNPAQPPEQRALEECPPPQEVRAAGVCCLQDVCLLAVFNVLHILKCSSWRPLASDSGMPAMRNGMVTSHPCICDIDVLRPIKSLL